MRIAILCLAACGSSHHAIHGTTVDDTGHNRAALATIEQARIAIESKQFMLLHDLVSPDYKQCFAPREPCIGPSSIQDILEYRFRGVTIIYSMHYDRVTRVGDRTFVDVTLDMQLDEPYGISHIQKPHTFVLENQRYRFTNGLLPPPAEPGPRDNAKTRAAWQRSADDRR